MTAVDLWTLALYGAASSLSISLMSAVSTLLLVAALPVVTRAWALSPSLRLPILMSMLWVSTQAAHLAWLPWDERSAHTLARLPLILVPAAAAVRALAAPRWDAAESAKALRVWIAATLAGLGAAFAYALAQFIETRQPSGGFMRNSIYWAYGLLPLGIFLGESAREISHQSESRSRWLAWAGFALTLAAATLTLNRVVPVLLAAYALWRLPRRVALPVMLVAGLAAIILYFQSPFLQDKVARTLSPGSDPSLNWRLQAWSHNWRLFLENPFFGAGPEKNGLDPARHAEAVGHWRPGHLYFAHSVYLQSLGDSGLVGSLLFFGAYAAWAWRVPATRPLLLASALAGLLENTWNNSKALHPLLFALSATIYFSLRSPRERA